VIVILREAQTRGRESSAARIILFFEKLIPSVANKKREPVVPGSPADLRNG